MVATDAARKAREHDMPRRTKAQILAFADSSITPERVERLRDAAGEAGDLEMVAVCRRALEGDEEAVAECVRVIREAEAQS